MNKHEMDAEQWQRLQEKSKRAWGARWRFKKIALQRNLSPDAIEELADQTINYIGGVLEQAKGSLIKEVRPKGIIKGGKVGSGKAGDGPASSGSSD